MLSELRLRALHLLLAAGLLLLLAPTPAPAALIERLARGATALGRGRGQAALAELQLALELAPASADVRWAAAQAAWMSDQPEQALQLLAGLQAGGAAPAGAACLEAEIRLAIGEFDRGLALLEGAPPACAAGTVLLQELSERLLAEGSWDPAERVLQQLAARQPESAWVHAKLGTLIAVHDPAQALDHLRLALQLDPEAWGQAWQLSQAIESGLVLGGTPLALAQAGQALATVGDWPLARVALEAAVEQDPSLPGAWALLGLALDQAGEDGSDQLERAVELAAESPQVQVLAARHWRARGQLDRALSALETAAGLDPQDPVVASELASLYLEMGDLRSAEAAYLHAVQVAADEPLFWSLLARFSLEQQHDVRSLGLPAARQALQLAPDDPQALDLLGALHYLAGDFRVADRLLWQALQLDPRLASAHYHRGLVLLGLGDLDGGVHSLRQARSLDPAGRIGELAERSLANLPP